MSNNQGEMMDIEKVRAEFEAWAKTRHIELTLEVNHRGYYYPAAKAAWAAWQAALAAAPSAAPVDAHRCCACWPGRMCDKREQCVAMTSAAPGAPREAQTVPEGWRAFLIQLSAAEGGMINGNQLSRIAKKLLAAAPEAPAAAPPLQISPSSDAGAVTAPQKGGAV